MPPGSNSPKRDPFRMLSDQEFSNAQEFDVTNFCEKILCCASEKLIFEPTVAVRVSKSPCSTSFVRLPYGELGKVDRSTSCVCCHGFTSGFTVDARIPGFGSDIVLVDHILAELQYRIESCQSAKVWQRDKKALGLLYEMAGKRAKGSSKIRALLNEMNVPIPQEVMATRDHRAPGQRLEREAHNTKSEYNVTSACYSICGGSQILTLEKDSVEMQTSTPCTYSRMYAPYSSLGEVSTQHVLGCCIILPSKVGLISPGLGCSVNLVDEIVGELEYRRDNCGDTVAIHRTEATDALNKQLGYWLAQEDHLLDALIRSELSIVPETVRPK
eukprot:TRINITY_DN23530_c0_g1_i1.p1 TRINITY_DN23530_c0_g1~~TRINITY_DN23530_c0_g1_i1.p1  ORF type:complete len:328 (+),score=26.31 TRINITY_DN23530_c0_g1_i1:50-1033(+)